MLEIIQSIPSKNIGQSHHDEQAKLCSHYCRKKCLKSRGKHTFRYGAEFPVNFRAIVLSVIQCLLAMKNHFSDARMVFELFQINASALRCSEPDLLCISKDSRFRTLKLSTFLTCLNCQFSPSQSYIRRCLVCVCYICVYNSSSYC